jgi:hypothetical protein
VHSMCPSRPVGLQQPRQLRCFPRVRRPRCFHDAPGVRRWECAVHNRPRGAFAALSSAGDLRCGARAGELGLFSLVQRRSRRRRAFASHAGPAPDRSAHGRRRRDGPRPNSIVIVKSHENPHVAATTQARFLGTPRAAFGHAVRGMNSLALTHSLPEGGRGRINGRESARHMTFRK